MSYAIESGIELPERRWKPKGQRNTNELPERFDRMRVGDSLFVPGISQRACAAAADWNRLHRPKRLETRAVECDVVHKTHGIRIWRTQ